MKSISETSISNENNSITKNEAESYEILKSDYALKDDRTEADASFHSGGFQNAYLKMIFTDWSVILKTFLRDMRPVTRVKIDWFEYSKYTKYSFLRSRCYGFESL